MRKSVDGASSFGRKIKVIRRRYFGKPDPEREQAVLRFTIILMFLGYLTFYPHATPPSALTFLMVNIFIGYSGVMLLSTILRPGVSPFRRIVGMTMDISAASYGMYLNEAPGSPLYIIILWTVFGNGIRYGRAYLFVAMFLGVVGFSTVALKNTYWRSQPSLSWGLLIGLVALPSFISTLLKRLNDAKSRAEEANKAKNRFIANMSHEMRTPLAGIMGTVEILKSTSLDVDQRDLARTIHDSSRTLLSMVEDVLDISKIEEGRLAIAKLDFDLHKVVKGTVSILTPQAVSKGLKLTAQCRPDVPCLLVGDEVHLKQVILNLLGNAIKFTEKGEVHLRVATVSETAESVTVRFEVSDTGIGISPEAQARIFDRFTQADESITRRFGGTGLGTTIAKEIVELMGGRIGVESTPGVGSTFWFTVELDKQPPKALQEAVAMAAGDSRILIVSGDPADSEALIGDFAALGFREVKAAATTAQAFAALVNAFNDGLPYHVAVVVGRGLDVDPFAFAKAVKADCTVRSLQIILASGNEEDLDLDRITKQGFGTAVRVPVERTVLFNALRLVRGWESEEDGTDLLPALRRRNAEGRRQLDILVAEDNRTNQELILRILELDGHATYLAENGEQALKALASRDFDLVFMDLNMPVMGGLEAARRYRTGRDRGPRVPIVALTADATPESRKACVEAGIDACLIKPFEVRRFLEMIETMVPSVNAPDRSQDEGRKTAETEIVRTRTTTEGESSAIDHDRFRELESLGKDGDFVQNLVWVFLRNSEKAVERMEAAAARRNIREFRDLAHALKGGAGSIGAVTVMEISSVLMGMGEDQSMIRRQELFQELKEELARVRRALIRRINKQGGCVSA